MNKPDPAIEAIRIVRKRISEEFGNDPARLVAHYIEYQKQFGGRLLEAPSEDAAPSEAEPAEQAGAADERRRFPAARAPAGARG